MYVGRYVYVHVCMYACMYGTAQRQLDTHTHAAGQTLSAEDYIMRSIFQRAPIMFVPTLGKLSRVCTHKRYT